VICGMKNERLAKLKEFLEKEPEDPFNLYAIALEYMNIDTTKAKQYFEKLLITYPEYLPTYYHAALLFAEFDENEKAKNVFLKGVDLAEGQKDNHALRELKSAYENFLFETEN